MRFEYFRMDINNRYIKLVSGSKNKISKIDIMVSSRLVPLIWRQVSKV